MKNQLRIKHRITRGLSLGALAFTLNLIFGSMMELSIPLQLGNSLILVAMVGLGALGGIAAFISGIGMFALITGETTEAYRFGAIAITAYLTASGNPRVNLASVTMAVWIILIAATMHLPELKGWFFGSEPQSVFWSDILSATLAGIMLLNDDIRCKLNCAKQSVTLLNFNCQMLTTLSNLLLFIGYNLSYETPTPLLPLVMFVSAVQVSALLVGYIWSSFLQRNMQSFIEDPLISSSLKNLFSGSTAGYWRKVSKTSPGSQLNSNWKTPFKTEVKTPASSNPGGAKPAICAINSTGEIIFATPSLSEVLNLPENAIVGKDVDAIDCLPIWKNSIKDIAKEVLTNGPQTQELKIQNAEGVQRFFELSGRLSSGQNQPSEHMENDSVMIAIRDITDRRCIEDSIRERNKINSLGNLVAGMTHAFSNCLTTLSAKVSLAEKSSDAELNTEHFKEIRQYTAEAGDMLRGLISLVSETNSQTQLTDLASFIEERLSILAKLVGAPYELVFSKSDKSVSAICNRSLLDQAITNLILYGKDAYQGDGGVISLNIDREEISIESARLAGGVTPGAYCRIDMCHSGKPLSRHLLSSLFDVSKNSHDSSLGLSIIAAIVRSQDGFITAETKPNKTTTISIYIPWNEFTASVPEETSPIEWPDTNYNLRGKRILVVEDEPSVREMTGFMLTALGCDVYTCENGIDAIAATQEQQFDLILLDYILPKISGHELLEKIKEINGEVKIVVMSGYGSNISEELASEVMQKPFDLDMLANKLNQALGQTVH